MVLGGHKSFATMARRLRSPLGQLAAEQVVEDDRAGGGGVERVDVATHRQREHNLAPLANDRRETAALRTDDKRHGRRDVGVEDRPRGLVLIESNNPAARGLQLVERAGEVRRLGHLQVLDGAG